MAYCHAALKDEEERYGFRQYMAEGLRVLTESAARQAGGSYLAKRWGMPSAPKPPEPAAEEIARSIIQGAGLRCDRTGR